jgi:serine/threonine protein kinase
MGKYLAYESQSNASSTKSVRKKLLDYEFVEDNKKKSYLGKGSYGSVRLVREKATGKYYALKIVSKK